MTVSMTYHPVGPRLAGMIDWVYVFRAPAPRYFSVAGAILPQLCWGLEGRFAWRFPGGSAQPVDGAFTLGASPAALTIETEGRTTMVGVGVFPEGWSALMPLPAGELAEEMYDLTRLWGNDALRPLDLDPRLPDAVLAQGVEAAVLARLLRAERPVDPRLFAINAWAGGAYPRIDALADVLNISHRQLDRLTLAAYGLGPRRLANKHRILRVAAALAVGRDMRREAWTGGFADQSHFNRHFKTFIGVTPTAFMTDRNVFVAEVMRARLTIASGHPLGLAQD